MKSTTWWTAVVCAAALGAGAVAARAQDMAGRTHANGPAAAAGRTVASAAALAARPHRALLERWLPGDAADSLYRLARRELNAGDYEQAARHFREVRERFPKSGYVADSYYWEAFALSRTGSNDDSRRALDVLAERRQRFPKAAGAQDARDLETQIRGQLARGGDVEAAEVLARQAATVASQGAGVAAQAAAAEAEVGAVAQSIAAGSAGLEAIGTGLQALGSGSCDDSDDERLMALNALLQMNSDQAVPLLKKVLERRDEGSVCLRRKALFVLAQKRTPEIEDVLLQAAGSDPDAQVRESAVFWLSQVHTTRATAALDSILQHSQDEAIRKRAVFALSQQHSDASSKALRDYLQGSRGLGEAQGEHRLLARTAAQRGQQDLSSPVLPAGHQRVDQEEDRVLRGPVGGQRRRPVAAGDRPGPEGVDGSEEERPVLGRADARDRRGADRRPVRRSPEPGAQGPAHLRPVAAAGGGGGRQAHGHRQERP